MFTLEDVPVRAVLITTRTTTRIVGRDNNFVVKPSVAMHPDLIVSSSHQQSHKSTSGGESCTHHGNKQTDSSNHHFNGGGGMAFPLFASFETTVF